MNFFLVAVFDLVIFFSSPVDNMIDSKFWIFHCYPHVVYQLYHYENVVVIFFSSSFSNFSRSRWTHFFSKVSLSLSRFILRNCILYDPETERFFLFVYFFSLGVIFFYLARYFNNNNNKAPSILMLRFFVIFFLCLSLCVCSLSSYLVV